MSDATGSTRCIPGTPPSESGFSLIEVLIAVLILAIALPVLLGLRNWDIHLRYQAEQMTQATLLAQEKLFETRMDGFPALGRSQGDFRTAAPGFRSRMEVDDRAPGFRWAREVLPTPLEFVREVRVRVAWRQAEDGGGVEVTDFVFLDETQRR